MARRASRQQVFSFFEIQHQGRPQAFDKSTERGSFGRFRWRSPGVRNSLYRIESIALPGITETLKNRNVRRRNAAHIPRIIVHEQHKRKGCGQVSVIYAVFWEIQEDIVLVSGVACPQDRITVRAIHSFRETGVTQFHDGHLIPALNGEDIGSHVIQSRQRIGFHAAVFISPLKRLTAVRAAAQQMQNSPSVGKGERTSLARASNRCAFLFLRWRPVIHGRQKWFPTTPTVRSARHKRNAGKSCASALKGREGSRGNS